MDEKLRILLCEDDENLGMVLRSVRTIISPNRSVWKN